MSDDAFLRAILACPEDDAPRLIYADWLEERGDPRGHLLRIAREMSQTPVCSARYRKLRIRRDALCKGCVGDWLKVLLRVSFSEIRKKLNELDRLDPTRAIFASDSHQYRLNAPLSVECVEQIELRIGCRLPEQYRRFVTEFADGGAGPDYGIQPLGSRFEADDDHAEWLASLARPFPVPANIEEMRSLGYSPPGALPICEIGCGGYYHLILSGPERGTVWIQNPDGDWSPALLNESHLPDGADVEAGVILEAAIRSPKALKLEFVDWYVKWLDEALWQVSCSSTALDELFDLDPETTELSVTGRKLTTLPERLRQLMALTSLNVHGNELTALPEWIGELGNLEFLGVGYNPLASLPESIGNLGRLKQFRCGGTKVLEQLPYGIGQLTGLEVLDLSFNNLKAVPDGIGNLNSLRELALYHNQLTALPPTIGGLRQLRNLRLTWNRLSQLPGSLASCSQLLELDLRANQFRRLPDCVSRIPALRTLNLGENPELDVAGACRELANVPTLRHLSLFMNTLTELPDEIGLLTQLTSLDLSWNKLGGLPTSLGRLTNLERLDLEHNPELSALRRQQQRLLPQLGAFWEAYRLRALA
jgi:uncharacterized protein (TIGR02996 family)